jgi:GR25 family glycosyltransferase involved in LPS biosynthesis
MARQNPAACAAIKDLVAGCFINLDRSPERRKAVQAELARAGLGGLYSRVPGIDGRSLPSNHHGVSAGELGCFLSHLGALEREAVSGKHIHVLEDDAILSRHFARHLACIVTEVIAPFDIVFTDMLIPPTPTALDPFLRQMTAYMTTREYTLIAGTYWACMSSYIVNARSVARLTTLLHQEVERGIALPVDMHIARLVAEGTIRVGCLFPFVTGRRFPYPSTPGATVLASTVMRPEDTTARRIVYEASQAAFYVEADRKALLNALAVVPGCELESERRALQVALMTLADAEKSTHRPRP